MLPTLGIYWTDEGVFTSLDKIRHGGPPPSDVIADINPFDCMPEKLCDGRWYLVGTGEKKDAETGFWKDRGEPRSIFSDPPIVGWRTTLEFYRGRAPNACKTDWLMQKYWIVQKGPCENWKESSSLCRVFLCRGQGSSHGHPNLTAAGGAGGNQIDEIGSVATGAKSAQIIDGRSSSQVKAIDSTTLGAERERPRRRSAEIVVENNYPSDGDYLEMRDLVSSSFSSENSSCMTLSSDECFDPSAFLQELDTEKGPQQKDADCKFNVFASRNPNKVVVYPAKSESLRSSGDRSKLVANEITKTDQSPYGSATKDNVPIEKVSAHEAKTEDPNIRSKLVANKNTKADHSKSGSATKNNLLIGKVSIHGAETEDPYLRSKLVAIEKASAHAAKTKSPILRKEGASSSTSLAAASSSSSGSRMKANMGQKKKGWIEHLCCFSF